jgi:prepilin-type N-terminal cleavage/methylation domain-containing protein
MKARSRSFQTPARPGSAWTQRKRCGGFSLVEVVVAIAILGVGIVALYASLLNGFRVAQLSRENLRATQVMVELMDTLRLYSWDQITDPKFTPKHFDVDYDPIGATNGGGGLFTYSCTMNVKKGPKDVEYGDNMKTVTLDIEWQNGSRVKRTRTFVTYVTRNGLQSYIYY